MADEEFGGEVRADIRREVEDLVWPEVIEEGQPSTTELLLGRIAELKDARDRLEARCERLTGRVEFWRRQASSWRNLAALFGLAALLLLGAWELFG